MLRNFCFVALSCVLFLNAVFRAPGSGHGFAQQE